MGQTSPEVSAAARRPDWLKVRMRTGENFQNLKRLVRTERLHTVCEEALCPNIFDCWDRRSATLMILGDVCTRSCGFCNVKTGRPMWNDPDEPRRTAEAVKAMQLRHAVITSVNRDELPDGGAAVWAETVRQVRILNPDCTIEVLAPDFKNDDAALDILFEARPDIFGHNIETVPRLYRRVRPQARVEWSLDVLRKSRRFGLKTKTAFMLGLGESAEEVFNLLASISATGCNLVAIGQYLQPTRDHLPVERYVHPDEFAVYRQTGLDLGFEWVESGPLVRSSYHADEQARHRGNG